MVAATTTFLWQSLFALYSVCIILKGRERARIRIGKMLGCAFYEFIRYGQNIALPNDDNVKDGHKSVEFD